METILQANPEDITAVYATFDGVGLQHKPLEKQIAKEKIHTKAVTHFMPIFFDETKTLFFLNIYKKSTVIEMNPNNNSKFKYSP